ncbi:Uncharacterised protein [uncultured archaeon]|nr:Uncharacterised protein [uncultured archaeon]
MSNRSYSKLLFVSLVLLIIFLFLCTPTGFGLTDLDYRLGKLKNSVTFISEQGFHGRNSAEMSVDFNGNYARIYIYPDEPLLFDDLDQLSMWINPMSGDGIFQIELYLDGDGDESYDSKNSEDARILSLKRSWSEMELSNSTWNELDGFDLAYEKYNDKSFSQASLDECKNRLSGKRIVKIYITIYKDKNFSEENAQKTSALIDYIRIGGEIISFEPLEKEDVKDGPKTVTSGGLITYIITYANNGLYPAKIVVLENYDPRTIFLLASPMPDPGTTNIWTFNDLPPGAHGQIVIKMRCQKPNVKANIHGQVSGKGYTSTKGVLSTDFDSFLITNSVSISSVEFNFTDSVTSTVRPVAGSVLSFGEHGYGTYHAEEKLSYTSSSISAMRDIFGESLPTRVNFTGCAIPMKGNWSARLQARNNIRDIYWSDKYYEAGLLNISSRLQLGKTLSYVETDAQILGMADRTANWNGGAYDLRLAGKFDLQGKARWKWSTKSVDPEIQGLECCVLPVDPPEGEG